MRKKLMSLLTAAVMMFSFAGCSDKDDKSDSSADSASESSSSVSESSTEDVSEEENVTEPTTEHVSPIETVTSTLGTQVTLNKTIERTEGSNTCKISLSDFIEEGDIISSFTFVIYSGDGSNIGTFKGGCGISVSSECAAATDEGWYQAADFSAQTQGTYGEIKWDVPAEIRDYISSGGEVLFGYWWGNATSVRLDSVVCNFTRTRDLPVDSQVTIDINKSVGYNDADNTIKLPIETSAEGDIPQAVTFNISSGGSFGKFTGAFGISCSEDCPSATSKGWYQSSDIAVFTDSSSLSLTWIIPDSVKEYVPEGGEIMLGYWWSEQANVTLDNVTIKYSNDGAPSSSDTSENNPVKEESSDENNSDISADNGDFRSAEEIVSAIRIGWNLGNTLECYDYKSWTNNAETAWGNLKTTSAMIKSVKDAGFNAIRIPVTWGEHMDGNTIDSAWMNRVQEVVDYAYNEGLFVILNMHHDDYVWFTPNDSEYSSDSAKLCAIWEQICERFEKYGDRLIFEGMNEPRTVGSPAEWTGGTSAERAVINKYEQDFVDTVRASGGNNAHRTLIVTSYAASADDSAINDVVIPDDDNIIFSVHYYAPWKFSNGDSKQFTESGKSELDNKFAQLKQKFISNGIPVIIDEFGCVAAADDNTRSAYYDYYISQAKSYGIKCFVWDNGVTSGESSYGIFNRGKLTWNETILNGIMNGAE